MVPISQTGNTLIVSLLLLLVLSVLGISSVGNVTLNQKVATNYRDADAAFQAAEAALVEGENMADTLSATLQESHFDPSCSGDDCFTASCNGGKCFNGTYSTGNSCFLSEPANAVYKNSSTWSTSGRYFESQMNFPGLSEKPRYIIEFLCYVNADPSATPAAPPPYASADWAYLFRITSYARGTSDISRAILQSTYKVLR